MKNISNSNTCATENLCCIIIPVYKTGLTEYEVLSLKQCCKVLAKYPIIFVTHKELDCAIYNNICAEFGIEAKYEYFNKKYFACIHGYNTLLLSKKFYARFKSYGYMLIYQLDAYVFRDELEYWCNKGYDYIGAPWLKLSNSRTMPEFYDQIRVGNGGFSLRNIATFNKTFVAKVRAFHFLNHVFSFYNLISKKNKLFSPLRFIIFLFIQFLILLLCIQNRKTVNEDFVWSWVLEKKGNIPSPIESVKFAFDTYPEYVYKMNNSELPFGCHDWHRYYNYRFFREFIQ